MLRTLEDADIVAGVDDVLQDEYGEGDGGEGDQVYLFIFSNTLSLSF